MFSKKFFVFQIKPLLNLKKKFVNNFQPPYDPTEDDEYKSSSDSGSESDEETAGIYSRLKAAKFNKLRATLSEDQIKAEKE